MSAFELTIQPSAMNTPPKATINFGPRWAPSLSTIQPSIGVSQVSSATKMLKATWIEAIDQPCAALIGRTNSVQPYCRFAIMIMQMTPAMSWVHLSRPSVDEVSLCAIHWPFKSSLVSWLCLLSLPVSAVECAARVFVPSKRSWARVGSPIPTRVFRADDEEGETHPESECHVGSKGNFVAAISG